MASVGWIPGGTLAALLALTGAPVEAHPPLDRPAAPAAVRIDGLDVEQVARLSGGTPLNFTLFGTPGATASLQIDGARRALPMRETERGVYEGTYTIEDRDRIAPDATFTAVLYRGAVSATATLEEPLVLGAEPRVGPSTDVSAAPPAPRSRATPIDSRWPRANGAPIDSRWPRASGESIDSGWPRANGYRGPPPPRGTPAPVVAAPACGDCAVVEWVRRVDTDAGDAGVAGAIAGGVLGAIVGNQIGHGDMRGFARVVGAVGGALAGREIERSQSRTFRYDVLLRRPDGTSQVYSYDHPPPFRPGDTVWLPSVAQAQVSASPYGAD